MNISYIGNRVAPIIYKTKLIACFKSDERCRSENSNGFNVGYWPVAKNGELETLIYYCGPTLATKEVYDLALDLGFKYLNGSAAHPMQ